MNGPINLPPPPGFRGLNPDEPVRMYQRNLPHWRQNGATYFVTFRMADSISQEQLRALRRWRERWEQSHREPRSKADWEQLAKQITKQTEVLLDHGYGECFFSDRRIADEMANSLLCFQDERCLTSCFIVMPNHVHVVMKPLDGHKLEEILASIKGFVSRKVNQMLSRSGQLWAQESYDRIIRDEEHLYRVVQYVGRNGVKAGLPSSNWLRWIHPEWESADWCFET